MVLEVPRTRKAWPFRAKVLALVGLCLGAAAGCDGGRASKSSAVPPRTPSAGSTESTRPSSSALTSTPGTVPPAASVPAAALGVLTIDVPGAGAVSYRLKSASCTPRSASATLTGGGAVQLTGSSLMVAIPGLTRRELKAVVQHHQGRTEAGGNAADGSAISVVFPC